MGGDATAQAFVPRQAPPRVSTSEAGPSAQRVARDSSVMGGREKKSPPPGNRWAYGGRVFGFRGKGRANDHSRDTTRTPRWQQRKVTVLQKTALTVPL